jgi:hypothetical protein
MRNAALMLPDFAGIKGRITATDEEQVLADAVARVCGLLDGQ